MKRNAITVLLALSLAVSSLSAANAAVTPGAKCSKVGAKQLFNGKTFSCIRSGSKLIWDKGTKTSASAATKSDGNKKSSPNSTVSEEAFLGCRNPVSVSNLEHSTLVVAGETFKLSVNANSQCRIDKVQVRFAFYENGSIEYSLDGFAILNSGNEYNGQWSYTLSTSPATKSINLQVELLFQHCGVTEGGAKVCTTRNDNFIKVCSPGLEYSWCFSSKRLQILEKVIIAEEPKLVASADGRALYCGLVNSKVWDFKADSSKFNVMSVLSWQLPNGEFTKWSKERTNWSEGSTQSGIKYTVSSNYQLWAEFGGLPTLKLVFHDNSGKSLTLRDLNFPNSTYTCRFSLDFSGRKVTSEAVISLNQ